MRERVPRPAAIRAATADPTRPLLAGNPLTQPHDLAPIDEATMSVAIRAPSNETAPDAGAHEIARALGKLPPEKLRQLEETEHLIVSIMISREIQRKVETLVGDHTNELGNLMKALAGFRYEVARETDRGSVEIYPPAKATPSALDQVIAEFKAAKGQE
jgi:hypothetical protein